MPGRSECLRTVSGLFVTKPGFQCSLVGGYKELIFLHVSATHRNSGCEGFWIILDL